MLCDIYSDINIVVGYDGNVKDISNYDFIKDKWEIKRADILKNYPQDIKPLVDGTSLFIEGQGEVYQLTLWRLWLLAFFLSAMVS